ncbi:MAG: hypothetical protein AB7G93_05965 [Bdellovibrionales bacterium]
MHLHPFVLVFALGMGSFMALSLTSSRAQAWGRRGHQIVGETAARVVAGEPGAGFMKDRSFDFGYYSNVPDLIWKKPQTYEKERGEHFMDMEIFNRAFAKKKDIKEPFKLSRAEFEARFPELGLDAGRAFWRIRELNENLEKVAAELRQLKVKKGSDRRKLQEKWLVLAGTLGHYVGDLGQPLHLTENYDGQMTGQKGVHSYFEDDVVEELYPELAVKVDERTRKSWPGFKEKNANRTVLELVEQLSKNASEDLKTVLSLDKRSRPKGRSDAKSLSRNAKRFESIIEERLTDSSLTLAEIYRRQLGWDFDGERFFFFAGEPDYLEPGAVP